MSEEVAGAVSLTQILRTTEFKDTFSVRTKLQVIIIIIILIIIMMIIVIIIMK